MDFAAFAGRNGRRVTALLFEGGFFGALASFSTFMSSPWTIERAASTQEAADATRKYTWMAHVVNIVAGLVISIGAGTIAPLAGTASGTALMGFIYRYSRAKGVANAEGWWNSSAIADTPARATSTAPTATRTRARPR
jgi:hypothetical protein